MKPVDHLVKVSPPVLNYVKQQIKFKHIMIVSINRCIINRKMKLMEMGRRDEIMLERETTSLVIILEGVTTILINPSLKRDNVCR
jgi:hypothetical protein